MPDYSRLRSPRVRSSPGLKRTASPLPAPAAVTGSSAIPTAAASPPAHRMSDTFPPGTLRSMIEVQAQWDDEDLRRLGLME